MYAVVLLHNMKIFTLVVLSLIAAVIEADVGEVDTTISNQRRSEHDASSNNFVGVLNHRSLSLNEDENISNDEDTVESEDLGIEGNEEEENLENDEDIFSENILGSFKDIISKIALKVNPGTGSSGFDFHSLSQMKGIIPGLDDVDENEDKFSVKPKKVVNKNDNTRRNRNRRRRHRPSRKSRPRRSNRYRENNRDDSRANRDFIRRESSFDGGRDFQVREISNGRRDDRTGPIGRQRYMPDPRDVVDFYASPNYRNEGGVMYYTDRDRRDTKFAVIG